MATTLRRWLRMGAAAMSLVTMGAMTPAVAATAAATPSSSAASSVNSVTNTRQPAGKAPATPAGTFIPLESYALLAQSSAEGIAVMRAPDRQLVTLRVGAVLAPAKARLVQIQGGQLKFEAVDQKGVRQIAWVRAGAKPEDTVQVERVSLDAPPQPRVSRPVEAVQAVQPNKNVK